MKIRLILLFFMILIVSACTDLAGQPEIVSTLPPPPTPQPIQVDDPAQLGSAIFAARCASCHGITGQGDGEVALNAGVEVPDFTDATSANSQSIAEWTYTIRTGRIENLMPPWENSLSPEEIDAVAEYTYNMWQNPPIVEDVVAETVLNEIMGTVAGTITQGTADAPPPASVFIGLHILDANDMQVDFLTQDNVTTSNYRFDNVTFRSDYKYLVTAIYNDIVFSSETLTIDETTTNLDVPLIVYELTDDPSVIQIDLMTTLLFEEGDNLMTQSFMSFVNTSDRVFRSNNQVDTFAYESIRIPLPANTILINGQALSPRFSLQETDSNTVLVDSRPVIPTENHMVEIVVAQPTSRTMAVSYPLLYSLIVQPEILITPDMYTLSGTNLSFVEVQHFNFGSYERFVGEPLPAGETLTMTLAMSGLPISMEIIVSIVIFVLGLLFIGIGVFSLYRQRHANPSITQDVLVRQIAELDVAYEAGKITEAEYNKQRNQLKAQLATFVNDTTV